MGPTKSKNDDNGDDDDDDGGDDDDNQVLPTCQATLLALYRCHLTCSSPPLRDGSLWLGPLSRRHGETKELSWGHS